MTEPEALNNLGAVSGQWLRKAGITSVDGLQRLGAVEAYIRVRAFGVRPSLNLLYALQAALDGVHWRKLPRAERARLVLEPDGRDARVRDAGADGS